MKSAKTEREFQKHMDLDEEQRTHTKPEQWSLMKSRAERAYACKAEGRCRLRKRSEDVKFGAK